MAIWPELRVYSLDTQELTAVPVRRLRLPGGRTRAGLRLPRTRTAVTRLTCEWPDGPADGRTNGQTRPKPALQGAGRGRRRENLACDRPKHDVPVVAVRYSHLFLKLNKKKAGQIDINASRSIFARFVWRRGVTQVLVGVRIQNFSCPHFVS